MFDATPRFPPFSRMTYSQMIRNSTAEFLIFTGQSGEQSIEVRYVDATIWLSQKLIVELFGVTTPTISEHLKNIYAEGELDRQATVRVCPKSRRAPVRQGKKQRKSAVYRV